MHRVIDPRMALGCVVKMRNTDTGDEIDLTDYEAW